MSAGLFYYFVLSFLCMIFCVRVSGTFSLKFRIIVYTFFSVSASDMVIAALPVVCWNTVDFSLMIL